MTEDGTNTNDLFLFGEDDYDKPLPRRRWLGKALLATGGAAALASYSMMGGGEEVAPADAAKNTADTDSDGTSKAQLHRDELTKALNQQEERLREIARDELKKKDEAKAAEQLEEARNAALKWRKKLEEKKAEINERDQRRHGILSL